MMDDSRLEALRALMRKKRINMYMIFLADYHASETVVDAFGEIAWLSGFTGTNATIVVSHDDAALWTDGRYFIQAGYQIAGSGIRLCRMGEEGVPTVEEYLEENLPHKGRIAYDGRVVPVRLHERYHEIVRKRDGRILTEENLLDSLWTDRPKLPSSEIWVFPQQYAGSSVQKKLSQVWDEVQKSGADAFLLTSLYDIAWLLNIRGDDIRHVPVKLGFFYMTAKGNILYVDSASVNLRVREYLKRNGIRLRPYSRAFSDMKRIRAKKVMIDPWTVSIAFVQSLPKRTETICVPNPTEALKAKKNPTEIRLTREAHIRDGVAVTKFIHYIKTHIGNTTLSECEAVHILHEYRKEQRHFLDESFDTISAYGANAAMMHYEPDESRDVELPAKGFLLVDSGGHYLEGTTDVTRTIVLGELSKEEIFGYTLTLRGALRLMAARFPVGTLCQNLDVLARGPFWDEGLDYRCGTGHGVGHLLNVHEGPNGFRCRITERMPACELQAGMITTDEPGLYKEDGFGVRIENELLCVEGQKTEYGQFLEFENLTMVPIDLDAVDASMLTPYEKKTLNAYHEKVYQTLRPYLTEEEAGWLQNETRAI